jgi:hypothetical protein
LPGAKPGVVKKVLVFALKKKDGPELHEGAVKNLEQATASAPSVAKPRITFLS